MIKRISDKSNIYKEEIFSHDYVEMEEFISGSKRSFITNYKYDHYRYLLQRTPPVRPRSLRDAQPKLAMHKRMYAINWLAEEVCGPKRLDDESFIFQAVQLMDQFYSNSAPMRKPELQLTAAMCFYIQQKNLIVDPYQLEDINYFCQF